MTLIEFLGLLKRNYLIVLCLPLLTGFLGLLTSFGLKESFEATQTFYVKREASRESPEFYTYDGYYAAQAAERFADSLFGALKSREVLLLSLSRTDIGLKPEELEREVNLIKVKRLSPQLVSFSYRGQSLEATLALIKNLSQSVTNLALRFNEGGDKSLSLSFVGSEPLLTIQRPNAFLNTALGFLLGLFAVSLILSLKHFFSNISLRTSS